MSRALIPNSTQIPDVILDHWMAALSGAEFKVLLYIARRTYGFGKSDGDAISLKQIISGIRRKDGSVLDHGTGLSRETVCKALSSLEGRHIIEREQRESEEYGDLPNFYRLNLDADIAGSGEPATTPGAKDPTGESENLTRAGKYSVSNSSPRPVRKSDTGPGSEKLTRGSQEFRSTPVRKSDSQETKIQETVKQETATTNEATDREGSVVASFFESFLNEGMQLLIAAGFSQKAAREITTCDEDGTGKRRQTIENIRSQLTWIEKRKIDRDYMGCLRKALEEHWTEPISKGKRAREVVNQSSPQNLVIVDKNIERDRLLRDAVQLLTRLDNESPEASHAFAAHIESAKAAEAKRPIVRDNPKRLNFILRVYETEIKRVQLFFEFAEKTTLPMQGIAEWLSAAKASGGREVFR